MTEPRRLSAHRADPRSKPPDPDRSAARPDPRMAGFTLVAAVLACAAAGLGLGSLVGLPVPFVLAGLFAGLAVGFALVYSRFKDI